ncbi:hypothetical protein SO802_014640 [Lithocarpus litseifolius]|uniref:F-box domain-containing protein n=1 Tax=Lithocarpus litseifolius TaxID=425828 RepID=A0AAW2CSR6_9ROSI
MANSATHHQSDSKRKKVELSQDTDTVVSIDRISNLSDSLICHILSFLSTEEAVVTSILSNRWKPLWTLVPKINLNDNRREEHPLSLTHVVYRVLALHRAPLLRNFSLKSFSPCDPFHLDTWIHTVIGRKVQHLHLQFSHSKKLVKLPRTVFTCKTIVILELRADICLCFDSIYPSMYLNLVRLEFGVNLSNWHVLKALLLVAPNLKVLVLDKNDDDEEDNRLCCVGPPEGSGCLSLLTAFSFDGYQELEHEVEFVKYVLSEERLLNAMTIKIYDKHLKESLLQRLSMFPRQSTKCLITVE